MSKSELSDSASLRDIESRISDPATPEDSIDEFYRFGQMLVSELQQRWSEIDRKLTIVLGWSIGVLSLLLFKYQQTQRTPRPGILVLLMLVAAALPSLVSVLMAAFALKTKLWRVASVRDWFQNDLWDDPARLKRYHLISLLHLNQENGASLRTKASCLAFAEVLLAISALAIFTLFLIVLLAP